MNFLPPTVAGDLVATRNSGIIPVVLGILALVLVSVVVVGLVINWVRKALHLTDPKAREKQRITTAGDLRTFAQTFALDKTELEVLTTLCRKNRLPHVNYYLLNAAKTNVLFQEAYEVFKRDKRLRPAFFSLFAKINQMRLLLTGLRTTAGLPLGVTISILDPKGPRWPTVLLEKDATSMTVTAPKTPAGEIVEFKELSRVTIMAEELNDAALTAVVRVLRYQNRAGRDELVLMQTQDIQTFIKQDYTYIQCRKPCTFTRCTEIQEEDKDGGESVSYVPKGEKLKGMLMNYTSTDCNMLCKEDVDNDTLLFVQVEFADGFTGDLVLHTVRKTSQGGAYLIHGKMIYMNDTIKTYMLARINGFEPV
jgi:hypothetical protein